LRYVLGGGVTASQPRELGRVPVRRPLAIEVLVIVRLGPFTPVSIRVFLALRRPDRLVVWVRGADARRLVGCPVRWHGVIISLEDHL
jgi:hypothetical protein